MIESLSLRAGDKKRGKEPRPRGLTLDECRKWCTSPQQRWAANTATWTETCRQKFHILYFNMFWIILFGTQFKSFTAAALPEVYLKLISRRHCLWKCSDLVPTVFILPLLYIRDIFGKIYQQLLDVNNSSVAMWTSWGWVCLFQCPRLFSDRKADPLHVCSLVLTWISWFILTRSSGLQHGARDQNLKLFDQFEFSSLFFDI